MNVNLPEESPSKTRHSSDGDIVQLQKQVQQLEADNHQLQTQIDLIVKQDASPFTGKTPPDPDQPKKNPEESPWVGGLGLVVTCIGVVLTCFAVAVAVYTILQATEFRTRLLEEAAIQAREADEALSRRAHAMSHSGIAFSLFRTAWDLDYNPTILVHVADDAIRYFQKADAYYEEELTHLRLKNLKDRPSHAKEIELLLWRNLNNLLFCIALRDKKDEFPKAANLANKFRTKAPSFEDRPLWINTYCRFVLTFLPEMVVCSRKNREDLLDEVRRLIARQEVRKLSGRQQIELERIKTMLKDLSPQTSSSS